MYVAEHRTHAQGLADLLLYDALVDDGVLLQQDGSLRKGCRHFLAVEVGDLGERQICRRARAE